MFTGLDIYKHIRLSLAELKSRYLSIHLRVQWEMSRQYVLLRGLFPYSGIARHTLVYTNAHKSNWEMLCFSDISQETGHQSQYRRSA